MRTKNNKDVVSNPTIPSLSIGTAVDLLSKYYAKLILSKQDLKLFPATMLWGPPGVGKSQGIREIAGELEVKTSKKVHITDIRLLLFNPVDLRGIPTYDKDRTFSIWLKPKIFDMDPASDVINILLLDEITAAPQSVQAAAYQLTLDRKVGEHTLPDNCIIFLAGNRDTDRSVATRMPKALANRLLHLEIQADFESFKKWAIRHEINERVLGFLTFHPDYLMAFSAENNDVAFATPRTWEMVSNIITYVEPDVEKAAPLVEGLISVGTAYEFLAYCKVYHELPDIESIFDGKCNKVPTSTDSLYALISSMTSYAFKIKDDMDRIANSISYVSNYLPPDFAYVLLHDYMYFSDDYKLKLMKIPAFLRFANKRGQLLNGIK